jgi:hypothetical protein
MYRHMDRARVHLNARRIEYVLHTVQVENSPAKKVEYKMIVEHTGQVTAGIEHEVNGHWLIVSC